MSQAPPQVIEKTKISFSFDPSARPVAYADSGDEIVFRCQDCYAEQIDYDGKDFSLLNMQRNNPITGPLFINHAEPGDVLKADILKIEMEAVEEVEDLK